MGKGDKKTAKGKISMGSYGKTRKRKAAGKPILVESKPKKGPVKTEEATKVKAKSTSNTVKEKAATGTSKAKTATAKSTKAKSGEDKKPAAKKAATKKKEE